MRKIFKIFNKNYPLTFFQQREVRDSVKQLLNNNIVKHYFRDIKEPLHYYQAQLIYNSIVNKDALQNEYEKFRNENFDLWQHLNYDEKNVLFNRQSEKVKSSLKHFIINDQRIFIPFFNERLNQYYESNMAIFDLKQYYSIYFDYTKELISLDYYKSLVYQTGNSFAQCSCVASKNNRYVLIDPVGKCLTLVDNQNIYYLELSSLKDQIYSQSFIDLSNKFLNNDFIGLINILLELFPLKNRHQQKVFQLLKKEL